jgi:hypothetical protein
VRNRRKAKIAKPDRELVKERAALRRQVKALKARVQELERSKLYAESAGLKYLRLYQDAERHCVEAVRRKQELMAAYDKRSKAAANRYAELLEDARVLAAIPDLRGKRKKAAEAVSRIS